MRYLLAIGLLFSAAVNANVVFEENFAGGTGIFTPEGNVFATNGAVRLRGDSDSNPGPGQIALLNINATDFKAIKLSFDRTTSGLDSGEAGEVLVSYNGGQYFTYESTQSAFGRTTIELGAIADFTTINIVFKINASSFFETYTIDNVVLEGSNGLPNPDVAASGYYLEGGISATTPDTFSVTNTGVIKFTGVGFGLDYDLGLKFDPNDVPFTVTSTDDVGFSGNFSVSTFNGEIVSVLMSFNDFDPGETFSFTADVDDSNGGFTPARELGESVLIIFATSLPANSGILVADPNNRNRATVSINGN